MTYSTIAAAVDALAIPELQSYAPKEILRDTKGKAGSPANEVSGGAKFAAGHYSLLLGAVFQSHERTLREEEVQSWSQQMVAALEAAGAKLRT